MNPFLNAIVSGVCLSILALSPAFAAPSFLNYPSVPVYNGKHAKPDLSLPEHKAFRTRIREGANEPANFAGEWNVTIWGCGTGCAHGVAINIRTGRVITIPGVHTDNIDLGDKDAFEMSLYSNLLIVNGRLTEEGQAARYYFVLTASGFEQIGFEPITTIPAKIEPKSDAKPTGSSIGLPIYPVDQGCSYFGSLRKGPEISKNTCIDQEQEAYDSLKKFWDYIPNQVRTTCVSRVKFSIGDIAYTSQTNFLYVGLLNCISKESKIFADQQPRSFKP